MKLMSRMCISRMISILLLKDASGTTIGFSDGMRLENISSVCADVKNSVHSNIEEGYYR